MQNRKSTKRALVSSALAMVTSVALLIGTTFAWFTDTASTGVNKIVSGNLKVDIVSAENATTSLQNKELSFVKAEDAEGEEILWEPGCRYLTEGFRIANKGNLALKWKAEINKSNATTGKVENGTGKDGMNLLDVIDFYVVTGTDANASEVKIEDFIGNLAATQTSEPYYIKGVMQTTANNDYQDLTLDGITITVVATQDTVESDSFNDQYDKNAQYPEVAYAKASTQDELNNILENPTDANGNTTTKIAVDLDSGTYTLPKLTGKDVAISGTKDTIINMKDAINEASSASFDGVTVEFSNNDYVGFQHTGNLTYKDCTITGKQVLYATDVEFINCTFNQNDNNYNAQVYGATNVTFTNCHFYSSNKNVYIYQEKLDSDKNATFNNCDFHMSATTDLKSAVMLNAPNDYNGHQYNVVINKCTAENANNEAAANEAGNTNYQGLYGLKHKDGNGTGRLIKGIVTVDGAVVYNN